MKKSVCSILCFLLLLLCIGCNTVEKPDDSNSVDLPDAPTSWRLAKQTMVQNGNTTVTTFAYNDSGRQISYETSANGVINSTVELGYDANGYKNYEKSTAASGVITEFFLTNDDQGRIVSQRTVTTFKGNSSESVSEFEYTDEHGSFVQTFVSGASKGNTVTVTKDEHGNELTHITSNGTSMRYENKYEGTLLVEKITTRSTSLGTAVTKTVYEYDDNGNNVKTTSYDELGNVSLTYLYEYTPFNDSQ